MKKIILKILIATLMMSAVLGILIIVLDLWNEITSNVLLTTATIFGFSIPGLCCSTIYEKENTKRFSVIGITICLLSCICFLLLIWEIIDFDFWNDMKVISSASLLSASFGHLSLLLRIDAKEQIVIIFKKATIILSAIMDILLLIEICSEIDISWKLLAVLAILIVLGTIVTPILNKISFHSNSVETDDIA
jgi:hypothetical protein